MAEEEPPLLSFEEIWLSESRDILEGYMASLYTLKLADHSTSYRLTRDFHSTYLPTVCPRDSAEKEDELECWRLSELYMCEVLLRMQ